MDNKYLIVVYFYNEDKHEVYSTLTAFVKTYPKYNAQTIRNAFCKGKTNIYKDKVIELRKLMVQR